MQHPPDRISVVGIDSQTANIKNLEVFKVTIVDYILYIEIERVYIHI